ALTPCPVQQSPTGARTRRTEDSPRDRDARRGRSRRGRRFHLAVVGADGAHVLPAGGKTGPGADTSSRHRPGGVDGARTAREELPRAVVGERDRRTAGSERLVREPGACPAGGAGSGGAGGLALRPPGRPVHGHRRRRPPLDPRTSHARPRAVGRVPGTALRREIRACGGAPVPGGGRTSGALRPTALPRALQPPCVEDVPQAGPRSRGPACRASLRLPARARPTWRTRPCAGAPPWSPRRGPAATSPGSLPR